MMTRRIFFKSLARGFGVVLLLFFAVFVYKGVWLYRMVMRVDADLAKGHTLSVEERRFLPSLYAAIVGLRGGLSAAQRGELEKFFGNFLAELPLPKRRELNALLAAFHFFPAIALGKWQTFDELSIDQQTRLIELLSQSPPKAYPAFSGLKELIYLAHYRLPENYLRIGYPGPQWPSKQETESRDQRYRVLLAKVQA